MNSSILLPVLFLFLFVMVVPGAAQQPATLTTEQIAENVYVVRGGIANAGFIVGDNGVLAIDAGMTADDAKGILAAIRETTSKPITGLILTHSDGDHVNGLGGFPEGIEIYSSAIARREMEEAFKAPQMQALRDRLPTKTFDNEMDIDCGNEKIKMLHFGPAHTSGDIVVFLPEKKTAFIGDLVFVGMDPLIHRQKGGTATGLIGNLQAILKLDADKFIPGHSDVLSKKDVEKAMANVQNTVDRVRSLIAQGKSLEETKKAFGVQDSPAGGFSFPSLAEVVYLELSEAK